MSNKRIIQVAHQPEPPEPRTDQERRSLDRWRLGAVEDKIDEAITTIEKLLRTAGLNAKKAPAIVEGIKQEVLYKWAWCMLYGDVEEGPPDGHEEFLEAKFGMKD